MLRHREGAAYASMYPPYEQLTPQWPSPPVYKLATEGYRKNQLIYACISKRAMAIAEAPALVYDQGGKMEEELDDHPLRELLRTPNDAMTEEQFWQVTEINLCVAGFAAWEKERNRLGEVTKLWPMRSDWCSFMRGDGKPLRVIRYQPYGLPPADVPIEDVLLFQYYDPLFPLLKGLSPTAIALQVCEVDNSATDFLKLFWQSGASVSGLLKTAQSLTDAEAMRIRDRWRQTHGGYSNWGDLAVLGNGTEYQRVEQTFKDMDFQTLDARQEARICMTYHVPPIVINARIGIGVSSYNNFSESNRSFYTQWARPEWHYLSSEVREQLLPDFEEQPKKFWVDFDLSDCEALQEDRQLLWGRVTQGWGANLLTRDEAREEIGLDPIDKAPVFYADAGASAGMEAAQGELPGSGLSTVYSEPADIIADALAGPREPAQIIADESAQSAQTQAQAEQGAIGAVGAPFSEADELKAVEARRFRQFAAKRVKEGAPEKIKAFQFKYTPIGEAMAMIAEAQPASDTGDPFPSWDGYG